jgi:hypothetical protein
MRIPVLATITRAKSGAEVRRGEPLTFGVPIPRGAMQEPGNWTLSRVGGAPAAAQTRVLARWPDGSIQWMLVDSRVDLETASSTSLHLDSASPVQPPQDGDHVRVSRAPGAPGAPGANDALIVETGRARFRIRAGGSFPFEEVAVANEPVIDAASGGLTIVDGAGAACAVAIESVVVEEEGPLRTVILASGTVRSASDAELLRLSARFHFFAGLPSVRLKLCLTNPKRATHPGNFWDLGDPGSVLVKDVSLRLTLAASNEPVAVECSPELGAPWERYGAPFELYQDSSGGENWKSRNHINRLRQVPQTFCGYRLKSGATSRNGLRATPIVVLTQGRRQIAATMPHFWESFPKAVEADGSSLTLRLFPAQYADAHEIQGGEQKTHECFLSFGADAVNPQPLEWGRAPAIASASPEWSLSSQAVAFLAPTDPERLSLVNPAIEGPDRFELKREVVDEYGWRHFGDLYGDHEAVREQGPEPLVSHYNNQYDVVAGFAYQFITTADPRWWRLMTELAAHVVDIDIYHTVRDKWAYNHGLFWHTYHYGDADTATHRSYPLAGRGRIFGGGPSADHNYTTGLMLHYFLTGEETSRQTVIDSADYVIAIDDGRRTVFRWLAAGETGWASRSDPGYYGPGRAAANSLNALVDGHRLSGEPRFEEKAARLVRRVIHPHDDIAALRLDAPEERWYYSMFLQSLGKYLQYKQERGQLDAMYLYARSSLLHYARWMAVHEYPYLEKPEKLEFPTETWAAQEIRKSDVFYLAAMYADGDERIQLCERALFFFRTAVDTLRRMPTRTLVRPMVIMLTSGLLHSWFRDHPDTRAPIPDSETDFGVPQRFVAQRDLAKSRAMWLGACAIALCLSLAIVALLAR